MFNYKKPLIAISIGVVVGLMLATTIFLLKLSVHGKFPPGTSISGIDISYKTPQQAQEILQQAKDRYLQNQIELTVRNTTVKTTPEALGIDILVDETMQIINETDATETSLLEWFSFNKKPPTTINILTKIDHEQLLAKTNELFQLEKIAPQNATFYFDNNENLLIEEGVLGLALNESLLIEDLKNSAKQLVPYRITLDLNKQEPEITAADLEIQKPEIQGSLWHEFVLIDPIYSDDWYLTLADNLDWVDFVEKTELGFEFEEFPTTVPEKTVAIAIKQDKLNEFIEEEVSQWLDRPPEPVNIYTDENNEIIIEGKGNDGLEIQREMLKKSIELAVANQIRDVPIPVLELSPEMVVSEDLAELGIKERIGVGHSSYYGSPSNRIHNINVGAEKHNGTLVAPGEIFSFNTNLGAVDGTTGYRKELVIKKEGTIPEYGGGLCQVSTTMYRAILLTGLPIVERNEHSYAVSYYSQVMGHGMDATIYLGGADLQFLNDTGEHILIQAYTEGDYELYFVFYGTSDGRTVEMEGPYLSNYHYPGATVYVDTTDLPEGTTKQVEKSHTGFNALWYRHITDAEGNVTEEAIETRYRAIPAKILVGVAEGGGEGEE